MKKPKEQEFEKPEIKLKLASDKISEFLVSTEQDFNSIIYTDRLDRCCRAFDITVGEHKLIIFCNDDGYIGFEIEDKK